MAPTDYTFEGWLGLSADSAQGKMEWKSFDPKPWAETDVDIKVSHCGICGSDLHTLRSGWGETPYPCCVGHEIVGRAVRVGKDVKKNIKVGDRVGVGAQSGSCLRPDCPDCSVGLENHCTQDDTTTYADTYPDGSKSYGGCANYSRHPGHFVFKIPDGLPSSAAAPMLCGGVTVYSPLKRYGAGPGKSVGIVGVGGLGHFGLLFAKALGAERVVAISRSRSKEKDARDMGADDFIATEESGWNEKHASSLDLIICTVGSANMPLTGYLQLLKTLGQFIQVGVPEENLPAINASALIDKGLRLGGSAIGSPAEIEEMLALAVDKGIKPWTVDRSMKDANQAIVDMDANKARYRYVLVNEGVEL